MEKLTEHSTFEVKESVAMNLLIGVVSLLMFMVSLLDGDLFNGAYRFKILHLTLIPAIFFIAKGVSNRVCIVINKQGLYQYGELITDWDHFIDAVVTQEPPPGSIQDTFVLVVRYTMHEGRVFRSKLPLPATQDKAEEEIIEAIRFFSALSRKAVATAVSATGV